MSEGLDIKDGNSDEYHVIAGFEECDVVADSVDQAISEARKVFVDRIPDLAQVIANMPVSVFKVTKK
ncbi:MAG: hypothetical protein K9M03_04385 [Kiritimatiellales bacterium]|nr:hypothetical protein [Kiritimatiellales bacterium]